MGIAIIIMSGLGVITVVSVIGSYFTEKRKHAGQAGGAELKDLIKRVESLESQIQSRDARIEQLEADLSFTTRLIEDKSKDS